MIGPWEQNPLRLKGELHSIELPSGKLQASNLASAA